MSKHFTGSTTMTTASASASASVSVSTPPLFEIGTRITVYWEDDDQWYKGKVSSIRLSNPNQIYVHYDDGDKGWIDITTTKWRRSTKPSKFIKESQDTLEQQQKLKQIEKLKIGTRLSIWWPLEKEYFTGTLTGLKKINDDTNDSNRNNNNDINNKPHFIQYDDGDEEWVNLLYRKFKRVDAKADRLQIGSRVSVYCKSEKINVPGTVIKIDRNRPNPHRVRYDDKERGKEWLNLNVVPFLDILPEREQDSESDQDYQELQESEPYQSTPSSSSSPNVTASTIKKRKRHFLVVPDVEQNFKKKKHKQQEKEEQQKENHNPNSSSDTPSASLEETCVVCNTITKKPRAASCHHIFCKKCIKNTKKRRTGKQDSFWCTKCKQQLTTFSSSSSSLPTRFLKYDPNHVSFKAVQTLERTTAEVIATFSSASAATLWKPSPPLSPSPLSTNKTSARNECHDKNTMPLSPSHQQSFASLIPARIIDACLSKQRDGREYQGYYWRFEGCKERILKFGESIKEGFEVEQIDFTTGEVVNIFPSVRKACEKTGISRCSLKRVLERRGKPDAGGYFWRYKGETHDPWPEPANNLTPVEQLDFETGDYLKTYKSLADAKRATGMTPNSACIREVCDGLGRATAKGYFWRWQGSTNVPNHMMGVEKIIQIRKAKNGKVIKEFRTSKDAQAFFGHQCCWSTICRYCREKGYYYGYYWGYRMLHKRKSPDEEVVGKRLKVYDCQQEHDQAQEYQAQDQPAVIDLDGDGDGTNHNADDDNNNYWLEGKIRSFDPKTKLHEVLFDCGKIKHYKLDEIKFEWKNDQGQKPIEQLDLKTGQVIASYSSLSEAATKTKNKIGTINAVCNGRSRASGGYFWRYKGSDALPRKTKHKRVVQQLCLNTGRVIATHESIQAAGKALGISTPGISYCCNGRNNMKSAGGYGWRFAETEASR